MKKAPDLPGIIKKECKFTPEEQTLPRHSDRSGHARILLAAPNDYRVLTPNLGVSFLVRTLASFPALFVDRAYTSYGGLPPPKPRSFEHGFEFRQFDLILLTLSFEPDLLNFIDLLVKAGIPPRREDRTARDPFVLAGGAGVSSNPYPLTEFVDLALLGDGEEAFSEFLEFFLVNFKNLPRRELGERFQSKPGFFVPGHPPEQNRLVRLVYEGVRDRPVYSFLTSPLIEFPGRFLIEVERGCPYSCRFCLVGNCHGAFRSVRAGRVCDLIEKNAAVTGQGAGLVGASVLSHPEIEDIFSFLAARSISFTISSLRAERITYDLARRLRQGGQKTLTLAPEAASPAMKEVLGKRIENQVFFEAAALSNRAGFREFKLYFLTGLPGETEADLLAVADFCARFLASAGSDATLRVSLNILVPKVGTPFADLPLAEEKVVLDRVRSLRAVLGRNRRVELDFSGYRVALIESLFSSGGLGFSAFLASLPPSALTSPAQFLRLAKKYLSERPFDDKIIR